MAFNFGFKSDEDLSKQYDEAISTQKVFTKRIAETIKRITDVENIAYVSIDKRTKSKDSFLAKALDPRKAYTDPINQITDLTGVRIICYYNNDVETIRDLIKAQFKVDEKNSIDKSTSLGINSFGYRSVHLVIGYNKERSKLKENAAFRDLKAEIQIRTICQHAWAEIEHKLNYKDDEKVPDEIMRRLFRISGLLEVADDEFLFVKKKIENVRFGYKEKFSHNDLNTDINAESLDVYLDGISKTDPIFVLAEDNGFYINPVHPSSKDPAYGVNKVLSLAGMNQISELRDIIEKPGNKFKNFLQSTFENWNSVGQKPKNISVDKYTLLRIAIISSVQSKTKQQSILRKVSFGPELQRALGETVLNQV